MIHQQVKHIYWIFQYMTRRLTSKYTLWKIKRYSQGSTIEFSLNLETRFFPHNPRVDVYWFSLPLFNETKCWVTWAPGVCCSPLMWRNQKQHLCQSHRGKKIPSRLLKKVRQLASFVRAVKRLAELIPSLKWFSLTEYTRHLSPEGWFHIVLYTHLAPKAIGSIA